MNFRRGHQVIVHDPGLNDPFTTPPTALTPPVAYRRWTVHPQNSATFIMQRITQYIDSAPNSRIDALHFMGHGNLGRIRIGRERFSSQNVNLFRALRGKVRYVVFFSCRVGGDTRGWVPRNHFRTFGARVSEATGANVVVAQQDQEYTYNAQNIIEFGTWEGPVDVYNPSGGWSAYQAYNPFRRETPLRLENLIFG
ncbi:MAG: hypothetical protein AAGI88_02260 [Pseudomonadota bacterium]